MSELDTAPKGICWELPEHLRQRHQERGAHGHKQLRTAGAHGAPDPGNLRMGSQFGKDAT